MKRVSCLAVAMGLAASPASPIGFYVTPDVPAGLTAAGTTLPWHVVRHDTVTGTYTLALALPDGTPVDGLHRMDSGDWLLSVEAPTSLGGTTFLPQEVILHDPSAGTFTSFFCGAPLASNVDALFLDGGARLILSYDSPLIAGGVLWKPTDLVAYRPGDGSMFPPCLDWVFDGIFLDSAAAIPPVPASTNVVGADEAGSLTIVTFDVPTILGGVLFRPGELVAFSGGTLVGLYYSDPAWPLGPRIDALSFLAAGPGRVPPLLTVTRADPPGTTITLSWPASCSAGAEDYAIYEGKLGSFYSHAPIVCSDAADGVPLSETITPGTGSTYYVVVPLKSPDEGSYSTDSSGAERPAASPACLPGQLIEPCP